MDAEEKVGKKPTHSISYAARMASRLYTKGRSEKTATLKQCIAAASRETGCKQEEIERYLAGAGARAISAALNRKGDDVVLGDHISVYRIIYDDHDAYASDDVNAVTVYDVYASSWHLVEVEQREVSLIEDIDSKPEMIRRALEPIPDGAKGRL